MWATVLVFLQILKVFLDLWNAKGEKEVAQQTKVAKEIVDAFATADPKERASRLNATVTDIRLRV